jgi:hypothetical protein
MNDYLWLQVECDEYMLFVPPLFSAAHRYPEWLRDNGDIAGLLALQRGDYKHLRKLLNDYPLVNNRHRMFLEAKITPQSMPWVRALALIGGWRATSITPLRMYKLSTPCILSGTPSKQFEANYAYS